ncbi:MAG: L,D-transpeptidase, partial [Synergistaceae bacterium]|nr:L,D-transpeptidase [Synergistaceae bacterium]
MNFNNAPKWKKIKANNGKAPWSPLYLCLFFVLICAIFFFRNARYDGSETDEASDAQARSAQSVANAPESPAGGLSDLRRTLDDPGGGFSGVQAQRGLSVLIEKKAHKLTVFRDGERIREYKVAVGKNKGDKKRVGDLRTPEGTFPVQQVQDSSKWTHDFKDGKGAIRNAYGPLFIRLKTPPWRGIGIHGTHDPASIGS